MALVSPFRLTCLATLACLAGFAGACGLGESLDDYARGGVAGAAPACAPMVSVPLPEGFSIDATEVTQCQYALWLGTSPSLAAQPFGCESNASYAPKDEPPCAWAPAVNGTRPITCIDWCDAYAYCKAMGKRLCGKIGGGGLDYSDYNVVSQSQWFAACTSGLGGKRWAYGADYEMGRCNDYEAGMHQSAPVAQYAGCQSGSDAGYAGVYDLNGNVLEWEDACGLGQIDYCQLRGGSYEQYGAERSCEDAQAAYRDHLAPDLGFRCCSGD